MDVLNEYSEKVNQRLRAIFMKTFAESLVAVMSGVGIKRTWKSEVSPWYNFFDEIEISVFAQGRGRSADPRARVRRLPVRTRGRRTHPGALPAQAVPHPETVRPCRQLP